MAKPKTVQIPIELFFNLINYHLAGMDDPETCKAIESGLYAKFEKMVNHELYSTYKSADNPADREAARQKYLDQIGISENFRW